MMVYFAIANEEVLAFSKDLNGLRKYVNGVKDIQLIEKNLTETFYSSVIKNSLSLGNNLYAFSEDRMNFHKELLEVSKNLSSTLKVLSRYMKDPTLSSEYKDACRLLMGKVNKEFREVSAKMDNSNLPKSKEDMAKAVIGKEMINFLDENKFEWIEDSSDGKAGWKNNKNIIEFNGAQTESIESLKRRFATMNKSGI